MKTQKINRIHIEDQNKREQFKKARFYYKKNRLYDAIAILNTLLAQKYDLVGTHFLLARCFDKISYLQNDEEYEDRAKIAYEELLSVEMKKRMKRKIQNTYNRFINRTRAFDDIEYRAYQKARQFQDEKKISPKAWMILGSNFDIRKDVDFVINAYKNAVEIHPHYIAALYRLGYIYQHNIGNPDIAQKYYIELVKLDPEDDKNEPPEFNARCILDGCNQLARILYDKGLYRTIITVFKQAMKTRHEHLPLTAFNTMKDLIYFADMAASHLGIRDKLDEHLELRYHYRMHFLVNRYCRKISVA